MVEHVLVSLFDWFCEGLPEAILVLRLAYHPIPATGLGSGSRWLGIRGSFWPWDY